MCVIIEFGPLSGDALMAEWERANPVLEVHRMSTVTASWST